MKAKDVLTWIVNQTITTEGMGFIGIDKDFDFESFFGYNPEKEIATIRREYYARKVNLCYKQKKATIEWLDDAA